MKVAILGNGPGLTVEAVEDTNADMYVGTNRSFFVVWSPIICSADRQFWLYRKQLCALARCPEPEWVFKHDLTDDCLERYDPGEMPVVPKWASPTGPFALWYTVTQLGYEDIELVGFGGQGHFYPVDYDAQVSDVGKLAQRKYGKGNLPAINNHQLHRCIRELGIDPPPGTPEEVPLDQVLRYPR